MASRPVLPDETFSEMAAFHAALVPLKSRIDFLERHASGIAAA
jgi:hypothetical protein